MPLPDYSDREGWKAFLVNPDCSDVREGELAHAFRHFHYKGIFKVSDILIKELSVRTYVYIRRSVRADFPNRKAFIDDIHGDVMELIINPERELPRQFTANFPMWILFRVTNKARQEIDRAPRADTVDTSEAEPITQDRPDDGLFLRQVLEKIPNPDKRRTFAMLVAGWPISGRDSIATKTGVHRTTVERRIRSASVTIAKIAREDGGEDSQ